MFRMGRQAQGNAKGTESWICRQTNRRQIKCAVFLRSLLMLIFSLFLLRLSLLLVDANGGLINNYSPKAR